MLIPDVCNNFQTIISKLSYCMYHCRTVHVPLSTASLSAPFQSLSGPANVTLSYCTCPTIYCLTVSTFPVTVRTSQCHTVLLYMSHYLLPHCQHLSSYCQDQPMSHCFAVCCLSRQWFLIAVDALDLMGSLELYIQ